MADEPNDGGTSAAGSVSAVNSQVIDSVSAVNALTAGHGPASAASMLSLAATETAALGMYNAIARQQADATINSAAVAALCARMLATSPPVEGIAAPAPGMAGAAEAQAQAAIRILAELAAQTGDPEAAGDALTRVAAAASAHKPGS
jgi:hypothetical protein